MAPVLLSRMVIDETDDEVQLDVRRGERAIGLEEASGLREIRRHHAVPVAFVASRLGGETAEPLEGVSQQVRAARPIAEREIGMVLQVPPDAWQMMRDSDPGLAQRRAVADARTHQDRRRAERTRREDDFAPRPHRFALSADPDDSGGRASILDDEMIDRCAGKDRKVLSRLHMRMDEGARGAAALAVDLRDLVEPAAFLSFAVEIVGDRQLRLARRIEEVPLKRIVGAQFRDVERSALAVEIVGQTLVVLRLPEVGKHVVVRPAGIALCGPAVVVAAMTAHVDHRVDGGRTA